MLSTKFIQRTKSYTTYESFIPAPYFRKSFMLSSVEKQSKIVICGLGFYKLYINGKDITKGELAPYISNPDQILFYDEYDVGKYLNKGKNVISVLLGNGFLNNPGGDIWDFDQAPYRDAPKFAMSFELDGKVVFEADETFKTADSPIVFDDYRCGEHYDATKEIVGWNSVDFDDSMWDSAIVAKAPKGEAYLCDCEPIKKTAEYSPIAFYQSNGKWIYKFPYNHAGVCKLKIKGQKGQKITLTHAEVFKDGELKLGNISFGGRTSPLMHRDCYICKGEGIEEYVPQFTYHGFQYVEVDGITDEQATEDLLTFVVLHSDIKTAGTVSTSDEKLNKLQEIVLRSDISNFHYFPTDCPQREKNGWTGDVACSAEQLMCNFHAEKSLAQWLKCVRLVQTEEGVLPGIIPTSGWGFGLNGPAWDTALIETTYCIYKYTANKQVLIDNIDAILKYLRYSKSRVMPEGLVYYGLPDWCQVNREAGDPETSSAISDSLTMIDASQKTIQMLRVLERYDDIPFVEEFCNGLRESFRLHYIQDSKIKVPYNSQTAISMAVYYNVFEKEEIQSAVEQLVENVHSKGDHFDTGVLGAKVLYRVLSDNGYADLAYKMITQKTFPSYSYIIEQGATTLWECFVEVDKGANVSSLNHHFWGDVSAWFYRCLAGININPDLQDPYRIVVAPKYVSGIDSVCIEREYLGEKIKVEWKKNGEKFELSVKAPKHFKIETY